MATDGAATVGPYALRWAAATHPGHRRPMNEDSVVIEPGIFAVADGMGGYGGGDVASAIAAGYLTDLTTLQGGDTPDRSAVRAVTEAIDRSIAREAAVRGCPMGTTMAALAFVQDAGQVRPVIVHVGDCRAYRLSAGVMERLTVDHSQVAELIAAGALSPDDERTHASRNVVTRALGMAGGDNPELRPLDDEQARIVLCSDGVHGQLDDEAIRATVGDDRLPVLAVRALVDEVLAGPAPDNLSVVVVDFIRLQAREAVAS